MMAYVLYYGSTKETSFKTDTQGYTYPHMTNLEYVTSNSVEKTSASAHVQRSNEKASTHLTVVYKNLQNRWCTEQDSFLC